MPRPLSRFPEPARRSPDLPLPAPVCGWSDILCQHAGHDALPEPLQALHHATSETATGLPASQGLRVPLEGEEGGGREGGRGGEGRSEWVSFTAQLEVGAELLQLQTYDRLFQRVVTVHHCVPLGLNRTVPLSSCPVFQVRPLYHTVDHWKHCVTQIPK